MVVTEHRPIAVDATLDLTTTPRETGPARVRAVRRARAARARYDHDDLAGLVAGAAAGDSEAWTVLTQRFGTMVMAIARSYRLGEADVNEVHQVTWMRLVENIGRIEQPERVGGWLATTARRESLRVVRAKSRVSLDHDTLVQLPDTECKPLDAGLLADEDADLVRRAFARLPAHCQRLLAIMASDNPPSYKEISKMLGMPIGSIGPTRGRCLEHLRRIMDELVHEV